MSRQDYSFFQLMLHQVGSTRWGAWFASRILHHVDCLGFSATGGRFTPSNLVGGVPVVMVTTIGVKSGLGRTLPLLYIRDGQDPDGFALIASNWGQKHHPAWYLNLKANPRATCSIRGQVREYVAHEAYGAEYAKFWQSAVKTYMGYRLYKERAGTRHIPIMVLDPADR